MKTLIAVGVLVISFGAEAADEPCSIQAQARSKYPDQALIDEVAQARATAQAEAQCSDGAIRQSEWGVQRWEAWHTTGACSPFADECPVERFYYSRATASFVCRQL